MPNKASVHSPTSRWASSAVMHGARELGTNHRKRRAPAQPARVGDLPIFVRLRESTRARGAAVAVVAGAHIHAPVREAVSYRGLFTAG